MSPEKTSRELQSRGLLTAVDIDVPGYEWHIFDQLIDGGVLQVPCQHQHKVSFFPVNKLYILTISIGGFFDSISSIFSFLRNGSILALFCSEII